MGGHQLPRTVHVPTRYLNTHTHACTHTHMHACTCMHMYITYTRRETQRYTCACITRISYYPLILSSPFRPFYLLTLLLHCFRPLGLASMKSESPNVRSLVKALVPLVKKCPSMTANDVRSAMYGLQGMHSSSKEGNGTAMYCAYFFFISFLFLFYLYCFVLFLIDLILSFLSIF